MNRLKGAFDEGFEELKRSDLRVKQNVLSAVQQERQSVKVKRPMPKILAAAVALFAVVIVGFLSTQFMKPQQQAAVINEKEFEMLLYENYELSNFFLTEQEAKRLTYERYIAQLALIDYVESEGLTIYEDEVKRHAKDNRDVVLNILQEQPDSWMHFHLQKIEEKFGLDREAYFQTQQDYLYTALVAQEMIIGLLHKEIEASNIPAFQYAEDKAVARFEGKYSSQLAAFREKYDIDLDYKVKRKGQAGELILDGQKYDTVIVDDKEVFKDTNAVLDTFMFQFEGVRSAIERNEGLTLFCYATLDDYKRGAEKLLSDKEYSVEAMQFMELLKVLKNSVEMN